MPYAFNDFVLYPERRELRQADRIVPVEPKVFDLLLHLIENRDRVLSKDDLIAVIWKGRIVSDSALTTCINAARTAIGDDGNQQRLIKTFPRKGFRFVAAIKTEQESVTLASTPAPQKQRQLSSPHHKPSIAVLPFTNLGADAQEEYFSDGVTDDIITELSRFSELLVIARNSSFQFKGKAIDVRQIGCELGVRYILEGSIRRSGDRVRISAQLIDAETGSNFWAERYERRLDDVFAAQDELARSIVSLIAAHVSQAEFHRVARIPPDSWEAYDYFLRGSHALAVFDQTTKLEDIMQAKRLFDEAILRDPNCGVFYASLSMAYIWLFTQPFGQSQFNQSILDLAVQASSMAIRLDPNLAIGHAKHANGLIYMHAHADAMSSIEKALRLNPNITDLCLGLTCAFSGEYLRGVELGHRAVRSDPFYPAITAMWLGACLFMLRRYEEAEPYLREAVARAPNHRASRVWAAANYARLGQIELAKQQYRKVLEIDPRARETAMQRLSHFKNEIDREFIYESVKLAQPTQ